MQSILDAINEWIKEILIGAINGNLSTMFGDVNEKVGTIAAEVGKTPQGWNASIFSMIQTLSENVIVPIAGLVITYVLCVELISMVTEKNNMHDIDTFMFFKWFFKAFVAVFIVTHTFDITMAVFDMAQHIVSGAAGVIGGSTSIDVAAALSSMQAGLDAMEIPELLLLMLETSLVSLCMKIMSVLITVVLYERGERSQPTNRYLGGSPDPQYGAFLRFEVQPNDPEALRDILQEEKHSREQLSPGDFKAHIATLRDGLIEAEAQRIVAEMKRQYSPNSPNKTHYMTELAPAFMMLASSRDVDRLFSLLPYKTLTFSKIEGRHGIYALIDKNENRDRDIRKPRPSIRAQLAADKKKAAPKRAAKTKHHEMEV